MTEAGRVSASNLNPGFTTLASAITSAGGVSISVTANAGFPQSSGFSIMIDSEQLTVTAGWGTNTWTVTRGANGTTATTHTNATMVFQCATSLIPIEPVMFDPMVARYEPSLMRNSFEKFYESIIVSNHSEVKGVKLPASYEVLTNLLSYAVKGGVTPTPTGSSYSWAFTPTLTADDLAGLGAEMGNDTAAYHIAALYCNQLTLEFTRGSDSAMASADFVGQMAFRMGAKTPGLTRTGLNLLNPAYTSTYLDTTTIGSTLVNDVVSAKVAITNGIQQLYFLNGLLYPTAIARPTRSLDIEMQKWFDDATELDNAMNTIGNGVERKVRLTTVGPAIGTSGVNNSLTIDSYGYWSTFPLKVDKDVWVLNLNGHSVYDVGAGGSWSMTLVNSQPTVP